MNLEVLVDNGRGLSLSLGQAVGVGEGKLLGGDTGERKRETCTMSKKSDAEGTGAMAFRLAAMVAWGLSAGGGLCWLEAFARRRFGVRKF